MANNNNEQIKKEYIDQLIKSGAKSGNESFNGLNNLKPKTTSSNTSSDKKMANDKDKSLSGLETF